MRLLLLDINPQVEQIISDLGAPMRIECRMASDLDSARALLRASVVDVVVLSPSFAAGTDSLAEVVQACRKRDASVVLILDTIEQLGAIDDSVRDAIDDFVLAPLDPDVLRARLDLVCRRRRADALRQAMLRALPDIMFRIRQDGTYIDFHTTDPAQLYAAPESIKGAHISDLLPEPQSRQWMEALTRVVDTGVPASIEYSLDMSRGRCFFEARIVRSAPDEVLSIVRDVTERKQAEEQIRTAALAKQAFASRIINAQEAERQHLSRELHDGISQLLLVHRMDAEWLAKQAEPGPLRDAAESLCSSLDETLHLVRTLAMDLRPPAIDDLGIDSALETLVGDIARRSGIQCEFDVDPQIEAVPTDAGVALYRIAQEALANAVRHARCNKIRVELLQRPESVELRVTDDGIGIDPSRLSDSSSFGLVGMRERAELVGGHVTIRTNSDDGTCIRATIPQVRYKMTVVTNEEAPTREGEP
jgi:two-component system, NarL family, sensor histidine kinase UhpB